MKKTLGCYICWKISLSENSFGFIIDITKNIKLFKSCVHDKVYRNSVSFKLGGIYSAPYIYIYIY